VQEVIPGFSGDKLPEELSTMMMPQWTQW
jgi:hypothetical protein